MGNRFKSYLKATVIFCGMTVIALTIGVPAAPDKPVWKPPQATSKGEQPPKRPTSTATSVSLKSLGFADILNDPPKILSCEEYIRLSKSKDAEPSPPSVPELRGPCEKLFIYCIPDDQFELHLPGMEGACSDLQCAVALRESLCDRLGISSDLYEIEDLKRWILDPANFPGIKEMGDACLLYHEITHGLQDSAHTSSCAAEREAYEAQRSCLQSMAQHYCSQFPDSSDCASIRSQICATTGSVGLQECRCDVATYQQGPCDGCQANCTGSIWSCLNNYGFTPQDPEQIEQICKELRDAYCC